MSRATPIRIRRPDISLTGKMGVGKTHLGDWLVSKCGYERMSFAGPIKDVERHLNVHSPFRTLVYMLARYGGVRWWQWRVLLTLLKRCKEIDREVPKPRIRLQFLGNGVREHVDVGYWMELGVREWRRKKSMHPEVPVVFEDARYPNEVARLSGLGFVTVKVTADEGTRLSRLRKDYGITSFADPRLHAESERVVDLVPRFDQVVVNNDDGFAVERLKDVILNWQLAMEFIDEVIGEDDGSKEGAVRN